MEPGGPKIYGCYGSGSATLLQIVIFFSLKKRGSSESGYGTNRESESSDCRSGYFITAIAFIISEDSHGF
jgi:hypothetical protein